MGVPFSRSHTRGQGSLVVLGAVSGACAPRERVRGFGQNLLPTTDVPPPSPFVAGPCTSTSRRQSWGLCCRAVPCSRTPSPRSQTLGTNRGGTTCLTLQRWCGMSGTAWLRLAWSGPCAVRWRAPSGGMGWGWDGGGMGVGCGWGGGARSRQPRGSPSYPLLAVAGSWACAVMAVTSGSGAGTGQPSVNVADWGAV